ncbi:uncharacterized protein LOC115565392, partial [Drosophila navojoa]|uniref:uncharacterized protein LOC115565392 n=1 Tax=Drosophila navojoa TaxID=7232 RepID=UPI0011BE1C48
MKVLTNMAEYMNNRIGKSMDKNTVSEKNPTDDGSVKNLDTVDLDNLFAFLTDGTTVPTNSVIEEINDTMNSLVQDLDGEIETCMQKEPLNNVDTENKDMLPISSLPEPLMAPPPPP